MGFLHLFVATYVRIVAQRPALNRFISGQRIFARHDIEVVMTVKRALTSEADETTIKVVLDPTDTIFDVYRKLNEKIDEIKADSGENNTEQVASALFKLPGLVLKFAIWFFNLLDYFGLLPKSLMEASPFHGSMVITDLGSLGIPPVYHHLYNFGNLPVFLSFGAKRKAVELDKDGQPVERKYIDFTAVIDERICDGYYYATAFKYLKYYLNNPWLLETPRKKWRRTFLIIFLKILNRHSSSYADLICNYLIFRRRTMSAFYYYGLPRLCPVKLGPAAVAQVCIAQPRVKQLEECSAS